jgi:hypothetical protein
MYRARIRAAPPGSQPVIESTTTSGTPRGDAVAAAMLDPALYGGKSPAVILTYAWDRLLIDPVPGPRGPANFTGLHPLTRSVQAVPVDAKPVAPAGSTLPRLAAELPHTLALIDPHHGAERIIRQLEELTEHRSPSTSSASAATSSPRATNQLSAAHSPTPSPWPHAANSTRP